MQPRTTIYLDYAATSPLWPDARAAMAPYLDERYANASSLYAAAREARKAIEEAREIIAAAVGARPDEVIFTSGGTEADNIAVQGAAFRARNEGRDGIVVSAIEHHAVLDTAQWLGRNGFRVTEVPVDADGVLDVEALGRVVDKKTGVVSVMAANNEVGTIQPIARAGEIARAAGARFHTDAVQALPWIAVDVADTDLIALAGHKVGGPKGVGALIVRRGVGIEPLVHGGGQERGLRSGTYNVAGIVGFGAAVKTTLDARDQLVPRVRALRDRLQDALTTRIPKVTVNGARAERLPNNCNVCIDGIESEPLLLLLDAAGIAASSGSACQSGAAEASHVLTAMGVPKARALGALRLTLGRDTTAQEIDAAVGEIEAGVKRLRA
ncbi:MAG TPA: cysteine desulfurase family protein [Actinomycetota bacterium]|nr:cysteine desulfurase family protein [Actinomycetota bacterium]